MNKKIHSLIKALERQYGSAVQISVEKPKETEAILYTGYMKGTKKQFFYPTTKEVYGSLEERPCEVLPLSTNDSEIQHDLELICGKYDSVQQLNQKIRKIEELDFFCCFAVCEFHPGLLENLTQKYEVKEEEMHYAHGSNVEWYTVDGVKANLGDWKKGRPDLFAESVTYLKNNNINFRYNSFIAIPTGVYIDDSGDLWGGHEILKEYFGTEELDGKNLTQKIADIKLELLK